MSSSIPKQAAIEGDLDRTRAHLSGSLGELRTRMTPGQVIDDLMRYFRGQEGAEFGRNLMDNVRSNPMPAAVTGIGLTWLMATSKRPGPAQAPAAVGATSKVRVYHPGQGYNEGGYKAVAARVNVAEMGVVRAIDEPDLDYTARLDDARGQALGLARHAQESTPSFSQRVRDALAAAQGTAAELGQGLSDRAGGLASTVGSQLQDVTDAVSHGTQQAGGAMSQGSDAVSQATGKMMKTLTETPLLLGALGLAAGALLGAFLPQPEQEAAALHDAAEAARQNASRLAQQTVDEGKNIGQAVVDKGMESADQQKLTGSRSAGEVVDAALGGTLATDAKQVATDVLKAGDEAFRKTALGEKPSEGSAA